MAKAEARKYEFENTSKGMIHVKEVRRALSPGCKMVRECVLSDKTKNFPGLKVTDLGPGDADAEKDRVAQSRAKMAASVKETLRKQRRKDAGGKAEAVSASEMEVKAPEPKAEAKPEPKPEPPAAEAKPDPEPEPDKASSGLDELLSGGGKKNKGKKKK
ncbi:MAG: hypothetical protein ACYTBJ_05415 [Planctomycetota bacterium]|jgi:hypothetical protein